jgi:thiamine pyrophosphate-dependent acetolactate synthase large subunit-like protein
MSYLVRAEAAQTLLSGIQDELVICGLGSPVSEVSRVNHRDLNFYLSGAMGSAATVGLGLALARPDKTVLVVTGDGELMMNVGSLATIGVMKPKNLAIIVMDNERFGETGQQLSHTGLGIDIAGIALASGFPEAVTVREQRMLPAVVQRMRAGAGPYLAVIKVQAGQVPMSIPQKDGVINKGRFRRALLGAE